MAAGWDPNALLWGPEVSGEGEMDQSYTSPDTCHICPVAQGDAPAPTYMSALMSPVLQQMVKNLHAQRFDDTAEN